MPETLTFHFEGALADSHRMNFYEAARFQYAAARLMVKLAQFRKNGKFTQKITNNTNFDVQLKSQSDGSFNIIIEDPGQPAADDQFVRIPISDLLAFVSERIVEKIDENTLNSVSQANGRRLASSRAEDADPAVALKMLIDAAMEDKALTAGLPPDVQDLVKRRVAEAYRERRLSESQAAIAHIDFARSQKLIAMSAPLLSEMATPLRKSANTLEIYSSTDGHARSILFLDQQMAQEIETAMVDDEITPLLGNIIQFNKDNGWGKLKVENSTMVYSFSIPYDLLPSMKQRLIDSMKRDRVFLQTYYVRDRGGEVSRLIAVGILPTPED